MLFSRWTKSNNSSGNSRIPQQSSSSSYYPNSDLDTDDTDDSERSFNISSPSSSSSSSIGSGIGSSSSSSSTKTEFTFLIRVDQLEQIPGFFQPKVCVLLRIGSTIIGKTEFRVVSTNTGQIKYNQAFEFQATLTQDPNPNKQNKQGGVAFQSKPLFFDILVKKGQKISTISRNNQLDLAHFASLNRAVTDKDLLTVTVHDGINVPLNVTITSTPSVIGRRGKSLDFSLTRNASHASSGGGNGSSSNTAPTKLTNTNNNNNNTTNNNNMTTPTTTTVGGGGINSNSTTPTVNASQSVFQQQDVPSSPSTPNQSNNNKQFSFEDIAKRRATSNAGRTNSIGGGGSGTNLLSLVDLGDSSPSPATRITPTKTNMTPTMTTTTTMMNGNGQDKIAVLQQENQELRNELALVRRELEQLRLENANLKKLQQQQNSSSGIVAVVDPSYVQEEELLENSFRVHSASAADTVDQFF